MREAGDDLAVKSAKAVAAGSVAEAGSVIGAAVANAAARKKTEKNPLIRPPRATLQLHHPLLLVLLLRRLFYPTGKLLCRLLREDAALPPPLPPHLANAEEEDLNPPRLEEGRRPATEADPPPRRLRKYCGPKQPRILATCSFLRSFARTIRSHHSLVRSHRSLVCLLRRLLRWRTPLHLLVRSLARALTPELVGKGCLKTIWF